MDVPIPRVRWYPVDPSRAHFRAHRCIIRRCPVPQIQEQIVEIVFLLSGADSAAHWNRLSTFPYHRWWKKLWKRFSENRRLVVCTEIGSPLVIFLISVEVEKFPRASCSSAGRPRQVAADRAHRKCARRQESRNRAGGMRWSKSRALNPLAQAATSLHSLTRCQAARVSVISKSGRSGQSQTPEAMTQ